MFTESELLEVKVPLVILVTACFSRHSEGYYQGRRKLDQSI
jgi:hypothetical protein